MMTDPTQSAGPSARAQAAIRIDEKYAAAAKAAKPTPPESHTFTVDWDEEHGRGDPDQRFELFRLCSCPACAGTGKEIPDHRGKRARCVLCRGEGRIRQSLTTTGTPSGVGLALVTLAREGEWFDEDENPCALGLLDHDPTHECGCRIENRYHALDCPVLPGEKIRKWLILMWGPSPRNVSDAGRVLASAPRKKGGTTD